MNSRPAMRFFVDHCVPESVSRLLEAKGYAVIRLREKTPSDSSDHLVAAVAEANDAVLVTMDADFRQIASRTGIGRRRFKTLSLVRFEQCRESQAAARLEAALSLIEHEWHIDLTSTDRRMFVVIKAGSIRTHQRAERSEDVAALPRKKGRQHCRRPSQVTGGIP